MLLGLSTGIAVTSGFGSRAASASKSSSTAEGKTEQSGESTRPEMTSKAARTVSKTENAVGREMRNSRDAGAGPALHQKAIGHSQAKNTANVADVSSGASAASAVDAPNGEDPASENSSPTRSIKVVMQIENGRVLRASVSKSQAGMESYEAMALRIARQRRYPAQTDGQETVTIRIAQP
jgi:hypothetical protein